MSGNSSKIFRFVLVVLGLISAFVAVNVAFGGLVTLGWQGPTRFFQVTDDHAYLIRDSHARFYGGVYLGIAVFLVVASTNLRRYGGALSLTFVLIFLGGLARLTQGQPGIVFGPELLVSSVVELVGMPALLVWQARLARAPRHPQPRHPVPASDLR